MRIKRELRCSQSSAREVLSGDLALPECLGVEVISVISDNSDERFAASAGWGRTLGTWGRWSGRALPPGPPGRRLELVFPGLWEAQGAVCR